MIQLGYLRYFFVYQSPVVIMTLKSFATDGSVALKNFPSDGREFAVGRKKNDSLFYETKDSPLIRGGCLGVCQKICFLQTRQRSIEPPRQAPRTRRRMWIR